jgi:hypothetical protein
MKRETRRAHWVVGVLFVLAAGMTADPRDQSAPLLLSEPDAVLREPFSLIRGARELTDGRLILTDWIEQRIAVADLRRNQVTSQGRIGAGPTEFRMPSALHAWRGDSTLMIDVGNSRIAVLDRDGRIARTFQPSDAGARSPGGADMSGRLYFTVAPWNTPQPLPGDSVEFAVLDGSDKRRLGQLQGSVLLRTPAPRPRVPNVIFAKQDGWAVSPSGRVAIVRAGDYHVEWLDGTRVVKGPATPFTAIRVTDRERTAFVRSFLESSGMSGRGPDGGIGHTPAEMMTPERVQEVVEASTFAEEMPAFRAGDVRIDGEGRVWVGRWSRHGEAREYDVFDEAGRRMRTIRLRADRHVIAAGRRHVYVAATSDDGLQTVERYPIPTFGGSR